MNWEARDEAWNRFLALVDWFLTDGALLFLFSERLDGVECHRVLPSNES